MTKDTLSRYLLLYGSQTGQAKAIAEEICEKSSKYGLSADLHCLGQTERKFNLERETCVVFVVSTTGDGEPPDTALKFWRRIKKRTLSDEHFAHLHYSLLGLGDSNYTNFCDCGKTFNKRLQEIGAKLFYPQGWADDAVGLELVVEPWIDGLWEPLRKLLGVRDSPLITNDIVIPCDRIDKPCNLTCDKNSKSGSSKDNIIEDNDKSIDEGDDKMHKGNKSDSSDLFNNKCAVNTMEEACTSRPETKNSTTEDKLDLNSTKLNEGNSSSFPPCVRTSVSPLSESVLTIPLLPPPYIKVEYYPDDKLDLPSLALQNDCPFPSVASPVTMATIISAQRLTNGEGVKSTLEITLDTMSSILEYVPGDSISVICPNPTGEVIMLLSRLGLEDQADVVIRMNILENTTKRNPKLPAHIPPCCSLRHLFTTCVDIREPVKKALLRSFIESTEDSGEARRLQELCSKQGMVDYTEYIRAPNLSVLDILNTFPSCHPSVERLIEHLPRLQPRPYSVVSSPLVEPKLLKIAFNIVSIPVDSGRTYERHGIATGYLNQETLHLQLNRQFAIDTSRESQSLKVSESSLESKMAELNVYTKSSLEEEKSSFENPQVTIFTRTNQHFHLPSDITVPIILIGPGTGIAPFIGFLEHREQQRTKDVADSKYGETWVFFGCRHKEKDFLYRQKLTYYEDTGIITKLCTCFSRDEQDEEAPRYVQDNLRLHSADILRLIDVEEGRIYVCGDAKNMAKDVNQAFIDILKQEKALDEADAKVYILKMRLHKRYLEDVWT